MARIIILKTGKTSTSKPNNKSPPGDKTYGIEPATPFHEIGDDDKTEEGEESEILFIHESILAASTQNLVNRKSPYIDTFDNEGPP